MKLNRHHSRFTAGEYSPEALARVDLDKTLVAAEIQQNAVPSMAGKAQIRPGTEYLDSTRDNAQARLIPFVRETDDYALIEMTTGKVRVMVDDAFITRTAVTASFSSGDFSSATGWTLTASDGASSAISGGKLRMHANAQGSIAKAVQQVTVDAADYGLPHSFRVRVDRGPVLLRIGTTSGQQDVIREIALGTGTHSLVFTPDASFGLDYYFQLSTIYEWECVVDSIDIETAGVFELDAPWVTSELREVSFDQSLDVVYFAHTNWQPRQLLRRGITSWSLELYEPEAGPVERVTDKSRLRFSSTRNNVIVTADVDVFTENMVGGIIRAFHDKLDATYALAGEDEYTEAWRVAGVKGKRNNDRKFKYEISGSWTATGRMVRSISGEDGEYLDHPRANGTSTPTWTSNRSTTHKGFEEDNNLLAFHKIGIASDDYTSGVMVVRVTHGGHSGYGWGRIVRYIGPRQVELQVVDKFKNTGWTADWDLSTWGISTGWPSAVAINDNRLWFGGSDTVWASAINAFNTFDDLDASDLATLTRQLGAGRNAGAARWFLPVQRLLTGTAGSIVSIRAGAFDDILTTSNVTLKDAATVGANSVSPVKIDSRGIFVHSSGSDVYVARPGAADYEPDRLTFYNDTICDLGINELAVQREPDTHIWAVRNDGQVPVCMYEFDNRNDMKCWWRFVTEGSVESVAVLPGVEEDRVYLSVNRTPDTVEVPETGAEELAPSGVDVFAVDMTDQSILVVDSATPANNLNTDQRLDAWGFPQGLETLIRGDGLKLTLQASGYLTYQPHNLAPSSYDFTVSEWNAATNGLAVGTAGTDTVPAPDGVSVMQALVPQTGWEIQPGLRLDVSTPVYDATNREIIEVSFYAYYESGVTFTDIRVSAYGPSFVGDTWIQFQFDGFGPNPDSFPGGDYEVYDDPVMEDLGDGYWRCRGRFLIGTAESTIRLEGSQEADNSLRPWYVWGLNIARLPNEGSLANDYSPLVQHADNAPRYLLPYQWDATGSLEGVRLEPAGNNLLSSGEDFSGYTADGVTISRTGVDSAPTLKRTATQLIETGSGVSRHGVRQLIAGAPGRYVGSAWVHQSVVGWVSIQFRDPDGTSFLANFNATTGEVTLESNTGLSNVESGVEAYPSLWNRVWIAADLSPSVPATWAPAGAAATSWIDGRWKMLSSGTSSVSFSGDVTASNMTSTSTATTSWGGGTFTAPVSNNMLTNGDFETGDFTGWAEVGGAYFPSNASPPGAYEGTWYARIFSFTFSNINQQNVDLLTGFTADQISSGSAEVTLEAAYTKSSGTPFAQMTFRFFDASFVQISSETVIFDNAITTNVWKTFSDTRSVPSNARYFSIFLLGTSSGSLYSVYWDSVVVAPVEVPDPVLTVTAAATSTFAGETGTDVTWAAPGAATAAFTQYAGDIAVVGSATVSFDASATTGSAMASTGLGAFVPVNPDTIVGDWSSAGSAATSWTSDVQDELASFAIWLADADEPSLDGTNAPVYEQTNGGSLLVWGAQLEFGRSRPSTYVPKEIIGTRVADNPSFDLSSIPWDDAAVTMFTEIKRNDPQAGEILAVANGADAHTHELDTSIQTTYRVVDDGADVADLVNGVAAEDTAVRLASSAEVNDGKLVIDGGSALVDTNMTMPTATGGEVRIGNGFDGVISRLMTLPQVSTEAELQVLGESTEPPEYRYIEKLALRSETVGGAMNKLADSGAYFAGPVSSVTCPWLLERTDLVAWATNASGLSVPLFDLSSDVDGVIELGDTYTDIWIGIGYTARFRSGKMAYQAQGGTALLQKKRVAELGLLLENTHIDAIRFGADFDRMRKMTIVSRGRPQAAGTIYTTYDDMSHPFPGRWDTDSRLCLEIRAPYPATILGLVIGMEWHERGLG